MSEVYLTPDSGGWEIQGHTGGVWHGCLNVTAGESEMPLLCHSGLPALTDESCGRSTDLSNGPDTQHHHIGNESSNM
jgi:hypothetical protein